MDSTIGGVLFTRKRTKIAPEPRRVRFDEKHAIKVKEYIATPKTSPFLRKNENESDEVYEYRKKLHKEQEHSLRASFVKDYVSSIGAKTPVPPKIDTIAKMKTVIQNAESTVGLKSTKVWHTRSKFTRSDANLDKHGYVMESLFWPKKYIDATPPAPTPPKATARLISVIRRSNRIASSTNHH